MPRNVENSAVATGLEKVSFHSNPKERQCKRIFKLLHSYTHLTHKQGNAENSPSEASTVHEPRTSRCSSWIQKRQRNQRSNCQHLLDHRKSKSSRKTSISALLTMPKPLTTKTVENSSRDGNTRPPDLPLKKSVIRSGSNSQNWKWNNRVVPNRKRSLSRLYIVTLLI